MKTWHLKVALAAERVLNRLNDRAAAAIVEFLVAPLLDSPALVGKSLERELEGYKSARRGPYRIIYRIDSENHTVRVVRIEHRADVYRPR